METRYLVLCDIDDTLFRSNTTFDFLAFVTKNRTLQRWWLRLLTARWSPVFLFLTALGAVSGHDLVRRLGIRLLKGLKTDQLQEQAFTFYDDWLGSRLNHDVWALVKGFEQANIFLISSTLDPVADAIAQRLGVSFRSSRLESVNGTLTGILREDVVGKKNSIARELKRDYPAAKLVAITDNRSDHALVELADDRYIVIRNEADKLFWSGLQPTYLRG
jgi:phosphoserine phosphatase